MSPVEAAANAYFEAINAADREAWVATLADEFTVEDPVGSPAKTTRDEMRAFFDGVMQGFSRVSMQIDHAYPCGSELAVKWTGMGIGKNGREVAFEGVDVFEVDASGRITRMRGFWDPGALMAQLQA